MRDEVHPCNCNSNYPVRFFLADAPYCKPDQTQVFGVAREETVRISCEVVANPVGSTSFEWRFNATGDKEGEMVDMPHDRFRSTNSKVGADFRNHCWLIIANFTYPLTNMAREICFPR